MKNFTDFRDPTHTLNESAIRASALATYGAKARKEGDASLRSFNDGKQSLKLRGNNLSIEDRLERIENALHNLFDGLIAQRRQIGNSVAIDVIGHTLSAKTRKPR